MRKTAKKVENWKASSLWVQTLVKNNFAWDGDTKARERVNYRLLIL